MKKVFVLLVGAMMALAVRSQVVEEQETALVYYSPKTEISLDFSYTMEVQKAGPYALYAEELLGVDGFVTEDKTTFVLNNVTIGSKTKTDFQRAHKVPADTDFPLLLTINDKGILVGYNVPTENPKASSKQDHPCKKECKESKTALSVAPYTEEILKATDSAGMAESIAQQIFHLRETRMYLLSGEVEHAPADGKAMQLVLDELRQQEQALTELFIGTRSTHTVHAHFTLQPEQEEHLLFFSAENGFIDGDNIDADTIRVFVSLQAQQYAEPKTEETAPVEESTKFKKGKKEAVQPAKPAISPIVYNLPGSADIQVIYQDRVLGTKTMPIAQIGIDIPLPMSLFSGQTLPVIRLNEKTGNIISISK